ncbi:late histone H1-like [Penaeus japonicus]|uniref:late histone H1-like n=1 Tax=Penaeus japonicus TaxID=27405 RepID=UPI001C715845|nr:late histone H1-like [Penaeus japonicus]
MVESAALKTTLRDPAHPKYSVMVRVAIGAMKERLGSSRQAIQKFILVHYKVKDEKKAKTYIKIALKRGVAGGSLKQTKGHGASGSFKLANTLEQHATKKQTYKKTIAKNPRLKNTKSHSFVYKKTFVKTTTAKNPMGVEKLVSKTTVNNRRSTKRDFTVRKSFAKATLDKNTSKKSAIKLPSREKQTPRKISLKKAVKFIGRNTTQMIKKAAVVMRKK